MSETTALTRRFIDEVDGIDDIPGSRDLEPGRIHWMHGNRQGKTSGVFYVKSVELSASPGEPWEVDDDRFEGEQGYCAAALKIAIIGSRAQWFLPGKERDDSPTWILDYQEGAKKLTEYLCFVEGLDDVMVLAVSGKYKAGPFHDIVQAYRFGLLKQASRIAKRQLPLWSFWLPIANQRTADGKVQYIDAQDGEGKSFGSSVTPPALYLPKDALDNCWAGMDMIRRGAAVWNDMAEWIKTKRMPPNTVEGEVVLSLPAPQARPALPPGRNVPQPISDEDLPF